MLVSKLRWGVLSTANIAVTKVIPAMQRGEWCEVVAIASRDLEKAKQVAQRLGIPKAYGSYEALLDDDARAVGCGGELTATTTWRRGRSSRAPTPVSARGFGASKSRPSS